MTVNCLPELYVANKKETQAYFEMMEYAYLIQNYIEIDCNWKSFIY